MQCQSKTDIKRKSRPQGSEEHVHQLQRVLAMPEMQANLLARSSLDENQKNPRHRKREPKKNLCKKRHQPPFANLNKRKAKTEQTVIVSERSKTLSRIVN